MAKGVMERRKAIRRNRLASRIGINIAEDDVKKPKKTTTKTRKKTNDIKTDESDQ